MAPVPHCPQRKEENSSENLASNTIGSTSAPFGRTVRPHPLVAEHADVGCTSHRRQ
jgi:hypothetical protein